jgi:hydrogenase 3 maturation protease
VAGVLVARRIGAWAARAGRAHVLAVQAGAAPENFTGELVAFAPDLVVLVDAAHLDAPPGAIEAIDPARVGGVAFSTHMLPVPILLDYLTRRTGCRTLVLGIQLGHRDVLAKVSAAVERGVRRLVAGMRRALER